MMSFIMFTKTRSDEVAKHAALLNYSHDLGITPYIKYILEL